MLDRTAGQELLLYCIESGISFIPYGPLAFGILGGKYTEDFKLNKGDWRQSVNLFEENTYKSNFKKVEKLKDIAKRKGSRIIAFSFSMVIKPKKELILLFLVGNERSK